MSYLDTLKKRRAVSSQLTLHQHLAVKIAEELDDMKHVGFYMKVCKTFPHHLIQQALEKVKQAKNPRNRGALFTALLMRKA